eukprot:688084-Amphidinium_carterae.1
MALQSERLTWAPIDKVGHSYPTTIETCGNCTVQRQPCPSRATVPWGDRPQNMNGQTCQEMFGGEQATVPVEFSWGEHARAL